MKDQSGINQELLEENSRLKKKIEKLEHFVSELRLKVELKPADEKLPAEITGGKWSEEELKSLHDRFLTVLDSIDATIYVADIESHEILFMNKQMKDAFGGDFTGKKCWQVFRNEIGPCPHCTNDQLLNESGNPAGICIWEDQNPITGKWYNNFDRAIRWVDGRIVRLQTATDITDRKRMEEELKSSLSLLSASLDSTADGILIVDMNGKIARWNQKFTDMWKIPEEVLSGRDDNQTINYILSQLADPEHFVAKVRKLYEQPEESSSDQIEFIDGRVFERYSQPQRIEDNIVGRVWSFRDITGRRLAEADKIKLEEQYRQAQKMEAIGQLAGGIAHDFNNMLNIILGYSQMALLKIDPSGPLHRNIEEIINAAQRSADLVRQLLAFARKQTIAPKALDLNGTVTDMLNMLRKLIGEDIDLLWMPAANLWPVKMDPAQIDQVLANLAVNARDSISGVGKIIIETGKTEFDEAYCAWHPGFVPGHYTMLAVSDNGCGMDKETCVKIFEPFFTTKEIGKGTGMGLATVYGIVKQNNGFINVYSEPGKGTTFKIYLLRHEDGNAAIDKPHPHNRPLKGTETILIVEDEEELLNLGKAMLEELGYSVLTASTPGEAIRLAGEHTGNIHLVLTDVVMPEMSGRDLQRRLSALWPCLKFLFMSGYTANVIAHRGILDEGVHFLQKPFHMEVLATKIREALEKQ